MNEPIQPEKRVLLLLDLAAENPIDPDEIIERGGLSSSPPRVFRATDFGAVRSGRGFDAARQREYSRAIEKMHEAALPSINYKTEVMVAGRAGLSSFAELGVRLSSWRELVTVVNYRRDDRQWDFCKIHGHDEETSYFDRTDFGETTHARGRVAVVVSSGYEVSEEAIHAFFEEERVPKPIGTIVLRAIPPRGERDRRVTERNMPGLAKKLCIELQKVKHHYPNLTGLAVFVSGPAQLAFLAGRAINSNVYPSIWFPHRDGGSYVVGSKVPWLDKLRVSMLLAAPMDRSKIDVTKDLDMVTEMLDRPLARERVDIFPHRAATLHDVFDTLMHERPHIVHFSGHANEQKIVLTRPRGDADVVDAQAFVDAVRSAKHRDSPPRLVILSACLTSDLARALTEHVEFTIGMSDKITDARAVSFARRFYDALASGRSLRNAYEQARAYWSKGGVEQGAVLELHSRPGSDPNAVHFFDEP